MPFERPLSRSSHDLSAEQIRHDGRTPRCRP
jgi:hypothetical protein